MELEEAIRKRRSIRKFSKKPVPKKLIEELIEEAIMAPSALNLQPWLFTVVTGEEREEVVKIISQSTMIIEDILALYCLESKSQKEITQQACAFYSNVGDAPVIIIVSIPSTEEKYLYRMRIISAALAVQNLMLSAHAKGLGTCCLGPSSWIEEKIKKKLNLKGRDIVLMLALGYPAEKPEAPPRRKDVVEWRGFND